MPTCQKCRESLLDYVYGLLDGDELQQTQTHLDACAECRNALNEVKTHQKLMARAAKAISQVAEFTLPGATLTASPAAQAPAATLPFVADAPTRRPAWRRTWVAWAAAAVVLLVVGGPVVWYRNAVEGYRSDIALARNEHRQVELELAGLKAKYEPLHRAALDEARRKAAPYLHVVGPKVLQPDAKAHLDVTTRHAEGELAACTLRVKLFEAGTGNVIGQVARPACEGHGRVEIDTAGARPGVPLQLLVEAESPFGQARVEEAVRVQAPTHVVRIDTNKQLYQMRDVLFFRVLVLDRSSLRPPTAEIPLRVALVHDKKTVQTLVRATGPGGILAGEFAVEESFPVGSYALEVSPVDPARAGVQSASIPLAIVRELPGIRLDLDRYTPGEIVTGDLVIPGNQPIPNKIEGRLGGKPVPITLQAQPAAPGGGAGGFRAPPAVMAQKNIAEAAAPDRVFRFAAPLPANLPPGANQLELTVPVPNAKKKQELGTVVPLEPTDYAIDFFPEGGDLVAGIKNRVFYRVRTRTGGPATGDGRVILLTGKNDIVDSPFKLGMGYFDFVPDLRETYTVRITPRANLVVDVPAPFASLGIKTSGMVMQVADPANEYAPRAVGVQGDPIRVTLRRQGPAGKVLLVAHCRGQIVDQRWLDVRTDPIDATLQPTPEAQGMIRVTAYEVIGAGLEPIAERLVYRKPSHRLDLTFTPDRSRFLPGQTTTAKIGARDESGKSASGWLLASVVDERFQAKPRSLSAHFLLLNEARTGSDLEYAQIIVNDAPESLPMLERFLGTHGWRRYVAAAELGVAAKTDAMPIVFSRESMPLEMLQRQIQDNLDRALTPIRQEAAKNEIILQNRRDQLSTAVNILAGRLDNLQTQAQLWLRLGLGIVLAVLLIVALVLMSIGIYRTIRARRSATFVFSSSFAALAACLGVLFLGNLLGPLDLADQQKRNQPALAQHKADAPEMQQMAKGDPMARKVAPPRGAPLNKFADAPRGGAAPAPNPTGAFALRDEKETERQNAAAPVDKADDLMKKALTSAFQSELAMNVARDRSGGAALALRRNLVPENETLQNRFQQSRGAVAADSAFEAKKAAKSKDTMKAGRQLEYPYRNGPAFLGDTLLWHPSLFVENGAAEIRFDIAPGPATYRVLLLGHGPTGSFGYFETRLDVPAFIGR